MRDFTKLVDLASERLGGRVLAANDEFFGPKENLLKAAQPVFIEGKYTARGKWMDGWETRRRREPGFDWCIIRLGLSGSVRGIVVDTSHFKGNSPEHCAIEACAVEGSPSGKQLLHRTTEWVELLPKTPLRGDTQNLFHIGRSPRVTHLRLKIFPDGGVARLRVHGKVVPDRKRLLAGRETDLAGVAAGGRVIASSDAFFSSPMNLLMPGHAKNVGDGWETRRRRGPGFDWVLLKLGIAGTIRRVEVDTTHFKGNFPESCSLEVCHTELEETEDPRSEAVEWKETLARTKLRANTRHIFQRELREVGPATHLRFNIFPDGGVSRLRILGTPRPTGSWMEGLRWLNSLPNDAAHAALLDCCGSKQWARRMAYRRPFDGLAQLLEAADKAWMELGREDWLEAFRHHPPIGGERSQEKQSAGARRWSAKEQSGVRKASRATLAAMAEANRAYHDRFGYIFIVCAAGKSSEEMLSILKQRLGNDLETELRVAAEEQRGITRLRLEKLLGR